MHELRIPIFPLPEVVFFPETVLPLHVFEPRYRQMIADCLAGDRWLAVAMLRAGWEKDYQGRPPVHGVAGAGEIIQAEMLADGLREDSPHPPSPHQVRIREVLQHLGDRPLAGRFRRAQCRDRQSLDSPCRSGWRFPEDAHRIAPANQLEDCGRVFRPLLAGID